MANTRFYRPIRRNTGRRGRSRTPTAAQIRDPASYISDADFVALREGRSFEASFKASSSTAGQPQPVTRKAPPLSFQGSQGRTTLQARQELLDNRLRFIAYSNMSVLDVRGDFRLDRPTSRDGRLMDFSTQGDHYDWLDKYFWCVAVAAHHPLYSPIQCINRLPDPNTHSGIVEVDTTDVYFYIRGWESWVETAYGWVRRY